MGIKEVVTAPRSPWQNPYTERLIGSIRRDCLDPSYSTPYLKFKERMAFTGSFGDKSWSRNSII